MGDQMFDSAVERANSRAAVLQGLSDTYNKRPSIPSTINNAKSVETDVINITSSQQTANSLSAVKLLQEILEDSSEKTRAFFSDSLVGKTIVIENVKKQINASRPVNQFSS